MEANNDALFNYNTMSAAERLETIKTFVNEMALLCFGAKDAVFEHLADEIIKARRYDQKKALECLFDICEKSVFYGMTNMEVKK